MIEKDVVVTTKHGAMPAFIAHPDGPGRFPPVIIYMDAPGIREELRNFARRIAKQGYFCLLPDMYYRNGLLRFDIPRRDDAMSTVIRAAMNTLTNALVADDTGGMLQFFDAHEKAAPGPVGCVGYCMSGRYVMTVAGRFPQRIAAAASLYGIGLVTDQKDSPHLLARDIKAEMYFGFAEVDPAVPSGVIPELTKALDKAGVRYSCETKMGTHHGYCFAERKDYDAVAAEDTWTRLFDLWGRNLR
jgi:carboxymethylenebutenolidase